MLKLRLALAQIDADVGDLEGNRKKIIECLRLSDEACADVVVFPELAVTGYPPEDLLLKPDFVADGMRAMEDIAPEVKDLVAVVGFAEADDGLYNSAAVVHRGRVAAVYRKTFLPNYGVFDEKRYFNAGSENLIVDLGGARIGITICEDIWFPGGPVRELARGGGAGLIVNLSASPFNRGKLEQREDVIRARAEESEAVMAYTNMVGGQDELVFDGGACVCHPRSGFIARADRFCEELLLCDVDLIPGRGLPDSRPGNDNDDRNDATRLRVVSLPRRAGECVKKPLAAREPPRELSRVEEIFEALVLGLREYVAMNGFDGVVLGLSGGVDSALTAALACEALGSGNVTPVFMSSMFTSALSRSLVFGLAHNLKVDLLTIPIEGIYEAYSGAVKGEVGEDAGGSVFENIQARIRGNILMALSNRFNRLVLATGNKSELSMGYCTLYGDMAGGFALIKDLFKTQVYELAGYVNTRAKREVIPRGIIERPPTAELREGQLDTDSLPPYELLDGILQAYIEGGLGEGEIADKGYDRDLIRRVMRTVDSNEYKRRQAPVGVKITPRAFGRDWRMPISKKY